MKKEYKVVVIKENALSSLLLGASKMPIQKMEKIMNEYGQSGWDVSFQVIEQHRLFLFWTREAVVITFCRDI